MSEPAQPFDFRRMGSTAAGIAKQMMDGAHAEGLPIEVFNDDLIGLAAHILSIPLHQALKDGTLVKTIDRWRELVRNIAEHEEMDLAALAVLGETEETILAKLRARQRADDQRHEGWHRTGEAARLLGMTPGQVRTRCANGELPGAERDGLGWIIPPAAIRAYTDGLDV